MDKELVTGGDQEDSFSDAVRIIPSDEESGSAAEFERGKWLDLRNFMGRSFLSRLNYLNINFENLPLRD